MSSISPIGPRFDASVADTHATTTTPDAPTTPGGGFRGFPAPRLVSTSHWLDPRLGAWMASSGGLELSPFFAIRR